MMVGGSNVKARSSYNEKTPRIVVSRSLSGEEISYTGSDGIEGGLLASIRMNHQALVRKLPDLEKTGHK